MEPKIRLKGCCGELKTSSLSQVATMHARIGWQNLRKDEFLPKGDYYLITGTNFVDGVIDYHSCYYVSEERYNQDKNIQLKEGSILITKDGTLGKVAYVDNLEKPATLNAGVFNVVCKMDIIDSRFLYQYLKSPRLMNYVNSTATGGTIKHLNQNILVSFPVRFPENEEQKFIGTYFQQLDSLIQSTAKKIESLKQVKAASLQSMFPQEGETTPRVRFKGFEGEWENKTLGECLTINNERNQSNLYGINDVLSVSDEVGVVNQIKLLGRSYAGKSVANYRVLKTNQIVYTKSPLKSKPYGIVKVNKGAIGIVSVLYAVYDANENVYPDYIHYYFEPTHRINNYLLPLINKGAKNTMNISDEMALTGHVWIPSFEEQKKIAIYLQVLDNQIILQTQRLEKLKQIESACLDNMFV